jgi:hypothetical protein
MVRSGSVSTANALRYNRALLSWSSWSKSEMDRAISQGWQAVVQYVKAYSMYVIVRQRTYVVSAVIVRQRTLTYTLTCVELMSVVLKKMHQ